MPTILLLLIAFQCVLSCKKDQKLCQDGLCVYYYCPEHFCDDKLNCTVTKCENGEVYCSSDGSCAGRRQDCPCPTSKPNHCLHKFQTDDRCYSESEECNKVRDCPNGEDESHCLSAVDDGSLNTLLFPVSVVALITLTVCFFCLRVRKHRSDTNQRRIRAVAARLTLMAAYASRSQPSPAYDDPPPPYPHDNPAFITHQDETELSSGQIVTVVNPTTSGPPGSEDKDMSLPPSYSEVISGKYIEIVPGHSVTAENSAGNQSE